MSNPGGTGAPGYPQAYPPMDGAPPQQPYGAPQPASQPQPYGQAQPYPGSQQPQQMQPYGQPPAQPYGGPTPQALQPYGQPPQYGAAQPPAQQFGPPPQQYGPPPPQTGAYPPGAQAPMGYGPPPGEGQPPESLPPDDGPKVASLTPPGPVRADLLPPIYHERLVLAKARSRALIIIFTAFALVVLLYLLSMMQVQGAQAELDNASAAKSQAQTQVNDLAEVPRTMAEIEAIQNALESALGSEVLMSQFLANITNSLPAGTQLSSVNVTLTIPPVPSADGLTQDVGDLSMEGTLPSFVSNAALIDSVKANPQLANVWVPSTSLTEAETGDGRYSFSLTADLTEAALSKRFTAEQLAEAAAAAKGAASDGASASATPEPGVTP